MKESIEYRQVVYGRWEFIGNEPSDMITPKCSICKKPSAFNKYGFPKKSRFCPECGAYMRGRNEQY